VNGPKTQTAPASHGGDESVVDFTQSRRKPRLVALALLVPLILLACCGFIALSVGAFIVYQRWHAGKEEAASASSSSLDSARSKSDKPANEPGQSKKEPEPKSPLPKKEDSSSPAAGLTPEVLARVKRATVLLRVDLAGPIRRATGSGFIAGKDDIVLTNAHVLGMLDPDSPPPASIQVVLNSGEREQQRIPADVLGVDRESDLAVLRLHAVPPSRRANEEPLEIGSALALRETQQVYIFGFPFGDALGKNVTVSTSSISSLRKNGDGTLKEIQVNGGMHPGNSGGPVVDGRGNVVGVAVAGIDKTQIGFAIPAEAARGVLNGRITSFDLGDPCRKGEKLAIPITVRCIDPLARIRKVELDWWKGELGPARPAARTKPASLQGDSARQAVALRYEREIARGELELPTQTAGKTLWLQLRLTDGTGQQQWLPARMHQTEPPIDHRPIAPTFRRRKSPPTPLEVTLITTLPLRFAEGKEALCLTRLWARLQETVEAVDDKGVAKVRALFPEYPLGGRIPLEADWWLGDLWFDGPIPREFRGPAVRSVGVTYQLDAKGAYKRLAANIPTERKRSRPSLVKLCDRLSSLLEVLSLSMPEGKLRPGQTWKASPRPLVLDLPPYRLTRTVNVEMDLSYRGVQVHDAREHLVIDMAGKISQCDDKSAQVAGGFRGRAVLDLETGLVYRGNVLVDLETTFPMDDTIFTGKGTLEIRLTRPRPLAGRAARASANDIRGTWKVVLNEFEGKQRPIDRKDSYQWIIDADGIRMQTIQTNVSAPNWLYHVDPATFPHRIDLGFEPGIFAVDGDTMIVCYNGGGQQRPTEFSSSPNSGRTLLILKRQKEAHILKPNLKPK
jgi:uncharacterized protein (TIGR03067 family)